MVINFLVESNGISLTLLILEYSSSFFIPALKAYVTIADSVGSPVAIKLSFSISILLLLHIVASSKTNLLSFSFPKHLTSFNSILFFVRVPVLSEQITLLHPKVSTAGNFLIIAFFLAILVTPIDSMIVTTAGNPSGIAATASPTDVINISIGSIFFIIPITKIAKHIPKATKPNFFPTSP